MLFSSAQNINQTHQMVICSFEIILSLWCAVTELLWAIIITGMRTSRHIPSKQKINNELVEKRKRYGYGWRKSIMVDGCFQQLWLKRAAVWKVADVTVEKVKYWTSQTSLPWFLSSLCSGRNICWTAVCVYAMYIKMTILQYIMRSIENHYCCKYRLW